MSSINSTTEVLLVRDAFRTRSHETLVGERGGKGPFLLLPERGDIVSLVGLVLEEEGRDQVPSVIIFFNSW